jgi:hypothetical protein
MHAHTPTKTYIEASVACTYNKMGEEAPQRWWTFFLALARALDCFAQIPFSVRFCFCFLFFLFIAASLTIVGHL